MYLMRTLCCFNPWKKLVGDMSAWEEGKWEWYTLYIATHSCSNSSRPARVRIHSWEKGINPYMKILFQLHKSFSVALIFKYYFIEKLRLQSISFEGHVETIVQTLFVFTRWLLENKRQSSSCNLRNCNSGSPPENWMARGYLETSMRHRIRRKQQNIRLKYIDK